MAYADIEARVYELLARAFPGDTSVSRGYHTSDNLSSIAVRPGRADRQAQGVQGRLSEWQVEIEMIVSSGVDLSKWHDEVLQMRQTVVDTLDMYPTLNMLQGVTGSMLTTLDEPITDTDSRIHKWTQIARLEVKEIVTIRGGEYG